MNVLLATYVTIGAFYGAVLVRRYAQSPLDLAVIVGMSTALWPFLLWVEKGR